MKINDKIKSKFTEKLDDKTVKGMERRGTLLEYYNETGQMKINAIKSVSMKLRFQLLETYRMLFCFHAHFAENTSLSS